MAEVASRDAGISGTAPAGGAKWGNRIGTIASALPAPLFSLFFGATTRFPPWFPYALIVLMVVIF